MKVFITGTDTPYDGSIVYVKEEGTYGWGPTLQDFNKITLAPTGDVIWIGDVPAMVVAPEGYNG